MWQFTVKPVLEQADCRVCAVAQSKAFSQDNVFSLCDGCYMRSLRAGRTVLVTASHWIHARRAAAQWLQVEPQDLEWVSVDGPDAQPDLAVQFGAYNAMELLVLKDLAAGKQSKKKRKQPRERRKHGSV